MEALQPIAPTSVGAYTLGALLGRGGMSEVYACTHPTHGDRLALKLLRDDADGAFHVEAATRDVAHPNVVRVIDAGLDRASRRYFIVMERLDGPDLATHLARASLDEPTARALFAHIADGMHAVHAHNIVHRDLKPANVMLHAGAPRIVDFGIAKVLGDNAALVTSRRIGTLGYMAPEQLVGGRIAPSVDVWALGVMLFEAVIGRLPFDGFTETYSPQLVESAPRVRSIAPVSPAYDALVAACLDPDPAKRPPMIYIARALRGEVAVASAVDERITQDIGALPALSRVPTTPSASSPSVSSPSVSSPSVSSPSVSSLSPSLSLSSLSPSPSISSLSPSVSSRSVSSPSSPSPSFASPRTRSRSVAWGIGAILAIGAIAVALVVTRTSSVTATANRDALGVAPATERAPATETRTAPDTGAVTATDTKPKTDTAAASGTAPATDTTAAPGTAPATDTAPVTDTAAASGTAPATDTALATDTAAATDAARAKPATATAAAGTALGTNSAPAIDAARAKPATDTARAKPTKRTKKRSKRPVRRETLD